MLNYIRQENPQIKILVAFINGKIQIKKKIKIFVPYLFIHFVICEIQSLKQSIINQCKNNLCIGLLFLSIVAFVISSTGSLVFIIPALSLSCC